VKLDVDGVITLEVTDPKGLCQIPDPAGLRLNPVPSVGPGVPGPLPSFPSPFPVPSGPSPSPANPFQPVIPGTIHPAPGWTTPMRPVYSNPQRTGGDGWSRGLPPGRGETTARAAEVEAAQEARNGDSDQEHN